MALLTKLLGTREESVSREVCSCGTRPAEEFGRVELGGNSGVGGREVEATIGGSHGWTSRRSLGLPEAVCCSVDK